MQRQRRLKTRRRQVRLRFRKNRRRADSQAQKPCQSSKAVGRDTSHSPKPVHASRYPTRWANRSTAQSSETRWTADLMSTVIIGKVPYSIGPSEERIAEFLVSN